MVGVGLNRLVTAKLVEWFSEVSMADSATVGGKGSSLGELYCNLTTAGVRVPNGFNVTVEAFQQFVNTEVPASTWDNVRNPEGVEDIREQAIACTTLSDALEICLIGADPSDHLN
ncbi:MAG TPA: hypothetical protein EYN58_02040, partial [Candidatus Poseidoniales archaeon]|nr:hypothetical protein [Candidatus Poseidoniales archaeon]